MTSALRHSKEDTVAAVDYEQDLLEKLNAMVEAGAGLDDVLAALDAAGVDVDPENIPADDLGRPVVAADCKRGYWNIRDAAEGDQQKARELAEWAARKWGLADDEIGNVQLAADRQIAQVKAWAEDRIKVQAKRKEWLEGVLDLYQQDFAAEEKTTKLVAGKLVRRASRPLLTRDEPAALDWALKRADVDEIAPRRLSVSGLNAQLTEREDGTFVDADGVVVEFQKKIPNPIPYTFTVTR